jgi:hypothetical protein
MPADTFIPTQYNDFLFALIGEEKNETPLSVLSALTRLDMDPWQEAARLTQLPKEKAITDINCALGALPGGRWTAPEANKIAARLVELLPSRSNDASSLAEERIGRRIAIALTLMWILFAGAWIACVAHSSSATVPQMHAANTVADGE